MTHLSPRQREIVELVGRDGLTYREVGEALGITRKTVEAHISVIVRKADLRMRQREVLCHLWSERAS